MKCDIDHCCVCNDKCGDPEGCEEFGCDSCEANEECLGPVVNGLLVLIAKSETKQ